MATIPVIVCMIGMILGVVYFTAVITTDTFHVTSDKLDVFKVAISFICGVIYIALFVAVGEFIMLLNGLLWLALATLNYLEGWKFNR